MRIKKAELKAIVKEELGKLLKETSADWSEEFERLKKAFIEKEVYARQAQIKNIMRDKLIKIHPSRYDSKNIIEHIARFIQATGMSIAEKTPCHGAGACYVHGKKIGPFRHAPGKIHIASNEGWFLSIKGMYTDEDGAFRNQAMGMFSKVIYHELGHAKEVAIDNAFSILRTGKQYSSLTLDRTRKCFPGLKTARGAREHHELPYEHYASLSQLRAQLGRPLNRSDIELVCAYKNKNSLRTRMQYVKSLKTWSAPNVKKGVFTHLDFLNNEIWDTFSCKNCGPDGDFNFALKLMNDMIARFDRVEKERIAEHVELDN